MSETMMQEVPAAVDPAPLFQVASGFMAAKHLFAASELGLFAALADGPATVHEIAQRTGLSRRAARISADAMVALGLVERDGGGHRNGAIAAAYLAGTGPADLRPFLRFWDRLSYVSWTRLADALRTGVAHGSFDLSPEDGEVFAAGVEAITAGSAHALADSGLLDDRRRLLDVGGGTGSFAVAALARHPAMSATVVEVEPVASVARARLGDRAEVVTADALADPLPAATTRFSSPTSPTSSRRRTTSNCCAVCARSPPPTRACCSWTSGPTRSTPTRRSRRSWPASSRCSATRATSTARTRSANG
jgi:hypothetical protein